MILVQSDSGKATKRRRKRNSFSSTLSSTSPERSLSTDSERNGEKIEAHPTVQRHVVTEGPAAGKPIATASCWSNLGLRILRLFEFLWSVLLLIPHKDIANFIFSLIGLETWKETPSWKENSKHVYDDRCTFSGYVMQKAAIRGSYAYASMNKSQRNMAKLFNNQRWESSENVFADDEDQICHGCRYQQINAMLMDCGHTVLCTTCAKLCTHCPICLKVVKRNPRKINMDCIHKFDYTRDPITSPLKRGWSLATLASKSSENIAY